MATHDELTVEQLEEFRGALEAEKDSLEEELASYGRVQDESGDWSGTSESEGEEADPLDVADNIEQLATNIPLVEELEKRHKDVEDALEKLDEGTYGLCEACEEPIPVARLEADAAARTCITHAV